MLSGTIKSMLSTEAEFAAIFGNESHVREWTRGIRSLKWQAMTLMLESVLTKLPPFFAGDLKMDRFMAYLRDAELTDFAERMFT